MSAGDADDDEVTIWAGRLRAWPTPPRSAASEEHTDAEDGTILSLRRAAVAPTPSRDDDVDDATAMGSRRRTGSATPDDGTQLAQRRRSTEPLRPREAETPGDAPERTVARTRRATPRAPIAAPFTEGRPARVPDADVREIYRPRLVVPEHAERAAPTIRTPQDPVDVAAASSARLRRGRRRLIVGVAIGVALAALAIMTVVAVLVLPA